MQLLQVWQVAPKNRRRQVRSEMCKNTFYGNAGTRHSPGSNRQAVWQKMHTNTPNVLKLSSLQVPLVGGGLSGSSQYVRKVLLKKFQIMVEQSPGITGTVCVQRNEVS